MAGPSDTITEARLRLWQYLSPAFPTGAFAYSSGLEAAMAQGVGRDDISDWIADWCRFGGGWSDAVLLAQALHPEADLAALDDLGRALCLSAERLGETVDQGSAFAATVSALTGTDHPPSVLPVAVGRACAKLGLPAAEVIAAYLHALSTNLVHAAVRFLPMGQAQGQTTLTALHPLIRRVAHAAAIASLDDLGTAAIGADLHALAHETMETRIFRT
jgi:urease accessory protein